MKAARAGTILNLGSVSWHLALPGLAIYQTAKAGIEGLTRGLARDLGVFGIRVNCVVPGAVRTPRQMKLWLKPEEEARTIEQQCLKVRIEPHDVAAMVCSSRRTTRACARHMSTSSTPAGVECVWALAAELGEGPIWSARERALWFVDIKGRHVHRYDEATRATQSWRAPEDVGFIVAVSGGRLIAA